MTNHSVEKQNKLASGLTSLTASMSKDFAEADKMKTEVQQKQATISRVERLRKFVGHVASIDVNEIETHENVRQHLNMDSPEFETLLESISKNGVQQNLIVEFKETADEKGYRLICVAGHRRLAAAKIADLASVPCLIKKFDNEGEKLEVALAENLLREGLHALDIADGYKKLLENGWSKEDLQKYFDRNQKTIRYYLKIAYWPERAKAMIRNNPESLPTRLVMRKFACKKFTNDNELLSALNNEVEQKRDENPSDKRISLGSKIQSYLETKRYSNETKAAIWEVMLDLHLVREVPQKD
jgi:ParB/RepB/Spo0J family partition protein